MPAKARRTVIGVVSGFAAFTILLSALGVAAVRRSFPQTEGQINLKGLEYPVYIYRDGWGIPHVYASSLHDLFLAQGYVHAQDRFWQMDFWRHVGSGRLAEMFGEAQVETDSFLRTLGWARIAQQEIDAYSPEAISILEAYSEGVNAYLAEHTRTALSLEYGILKLLNPGYQPEPWTPLHSVTWGKVMAWDLGGNLTAEIERAILLKTLTPDQVNQLFPSYPVDHPVVVPEMGAETRKQWTDTAFAGLDISNDVLHRVQSNLAILNALLGSAGSGIGSNAWALSGGLTATGAPLLANDPHLDIQMPSIWYQVGLHCRPKTTACPFEIAGFSFAGAPGVIIGHNEYLAWSFTNVDPDVMDLYIEKVNPDDPNQYEFNGQWVDMEITTDTLLVGGGEPVELTIRSTRHGPVISDTYGTLREQVEEADQPFSEKAGIELPEQYVIALRWTALEPSHIFEAIWGFDRARNWDEFRTAARSFTVPAQNLIYADVRGNIAYQMPGSIPIRKNGDGTLPVPGWTEDYDWTGYIPFEELPYSYNPPGGYLVAANNAVVSPAYPYLITRDWDYGYRAQRVVNMIENAPGPIDIEYIKQMQGDAYNMSAEFIVPVLMQVEMDSELAAIRDQVLGGWDYQNRADSAPAMLYEVFWWNLLAMTFTDEAIPEEYFPEGGSRWFEVMRNLVETPGSPWWDDKTTTNGVETRDAVFLAAFSEAVNCRICIERSGRDIDQWRWGDVHTATFRNATLGESGIAPIEALFNRGPFPTGGGESIVNATGWTALVSFEVDSLPSMRMIVDLGDLRNSLTVHTTGQSGHAYHPHYIDMAPLWAEVKYFAMLWNEQAVLSNTETCLVLTPGE